MTLEMNRQRISSGQIGVWGDSIVHGGNDAEKGGWVNRLKLDTAGRGWGDHVFGLGLGGDSSRDVLERIEPELRARRQFVDYVLVGEELPDGTHPDAAGHEKIFRFVKAALIREGALQPGTKPKVA
jgi:lysophospholipase L1-like esterase